MKRILQMSFVSTSGMTIFSNLLSRLLKENFDETVLLNQLVYPNRKEEKKKSPAGFILHYSVGTFFAALYLMLWNKTRLKPDFATSSVMGLINGLAGISVWHLLWSLHSNPPDVNIKKYYLQLLFAHMIFGVLNGLMFKNKHEVTSMG